MTVNGHIPSMETLIFWVKGGNLGKLPKLPKLSMLPSKSASGILPNRESFLRALREKISTISVCNVCIGSKKAFTRLFFDWESWIHAWKKFMGAGWGKKRWRGKSKKEPGTEGTGLILMVSIQMHFCRILAAACGSTPARASGTLFEAWQSEITYSICIRSNYTPEPLSIGLLLRCISFLRL